jgi:hypothetical protein
LAEFPLSSWFVCSERGNYAWDVPLSDATAETTALTVPADAAGKTIHLVLEVKDSGDHLDSGFPPQ